MGELAVLPQVVYRIIETTASDTGSAADLEKAIVMDPGFSAKVLTLANSAHYALNRKVGSIREAVMFLGFRAVRSLAMSAGVFDLFVGKNDKESLRRRAWWRVSLDSAVAARVLAAELGVADKEEAYTCGLLHLIGKTVLDRSDSKQYELVMALMERDVQDRMAEQAIFGCDHIDVAEGISKRWGFPESLVAGLNYGDVPGEAVENSIIALRACTAVAHAVSQRQVDGASVGAESQDGFLPTWALEVLRIDQEKASLLVAEMMEALAANKMAA